MLIYLYGPDAYRRSQKLQEITKKFTDKHSALSVQRFDLAIPEDFDRLKDFSTAQSLFDSAKFGIVYGLAERTPKELENILKIADELSSMNLVLVAEKALPKTFKILSRSSVVQQNFDVLKPDQLGVFIKRECEDRGLKLNPEVVRSLAEQYASDTWGLVNELTRLSLGGSPQAVMRQTDFFSSLNILGRSGSPSVRLPVLERLLHSEDSAKIFNILTAVSAQKNLMANYDLAIKSGKLEYEEVLTDLALSN